MEADTPPCTVFLTGATGYVGGRLAPRLIETGRRVRCLTRSPEKLAARPWSRDPLVEVHQADLSDLQAMTQAMHGCSAAYYLVHSMEVAGSGYAQRDRELATIFAKAAAQAGVERIIYLGGLGEMGDDLSEHLRSRREVENFLKAGDVPVTVLRAAMIIGSGSASFEILRYLTERLPIMITPRWVKTESQPIGIRAVLRYLVQCLDTPRTVGQTIDIGGRDVVTYEQLIQMMARALGLSRRIILPVPLLTPRLSSLWIHLVTPLSFRVARPLAEGLRNRVVCRDDQAQQLMPGPLLGAEEAIHLAVGRIADRQVETAWSDAGQIPGDPDWAGGRVIVDRRRIEIHAPPERVFGAVCQVGGGHGYYAADSLWRIRGAMDRMVGGPGLRRSRRHPQNLAYGDALDFWRVTGIQRDRYLGLRAEMKLPGVAMLEFEISQHGSAAERTAGSNGNAEHPAKHPPQIDRCTLTQTARFRPLGLPGLLYWYAVLPLHGIVFRGMLEGIKRAAEAQSNLMRGEDSSIDVGKK
ncbi:MAG: SDR family oxidoreductase [Phycisphaeraceae bacterium]|nr:SDR family oxidoreductase [Phycisphaeraceae bacterium]